MPFSVLSRKCSHGAHGLLRFRTNDVLLGTSGVGVCVSVVSNSSGMLYRFPELRPPFNPSVSCWKPSRWREVPSSKSGRPLYLLFTPERAQFRAQMLLRIRNRVLTLSAWCVFVFRHGCSGHLNATIGGDDMRSMAQTRLVPSDALGHTFTWGLGA